MITSDLAAGDMVYGIFSPFYYRVYIRTIMTTVFLDKLALFDMYPCSTVRSAVINPYILCIGINLMNYPQLPQ